MSPQDRLKVLQTLKQYERVPVSALEFINDTYYLGSMISELHERWKEELKYVLNPSNGIVEWILRGAIGTGKTSCAAIALAYKLYCLTCIDDPAAFYGLLPGSRIVFGIFSITLSKADRGYELLKQYLDGGPYFKEKCPRRQRPGDPISLPSKQIWVDTGSLASHALSENMFGFMLDEANFFKKAQNTISEVDRTRAHGLYTQAQRRQLSRFMRHGVIPGLNCLLSSQITQTEFLEERVELAKTDPTVHVTTFSLWDVKPVSIYCGKKFRVMIGDGRLSSRVLDEDEIAPAGYEVIDVPVEYRKAFEEDVDEALRDLAGKAVTGTGYFFSQREHLYTSIDPSRVHPFTQESVSVVSTESDVDLCELVQPDLLFHTVQSRSALLVHPATPRYSHVDIGLTGDSLGLVVGHRTPLDTLYVDLMLRIRAPSVGEVDLDVIIDFFRYLRHQGFFIKQITYDSYQSRHSMQRLRKRHFTAETLSVGIDEYKHLRQMLYAGQVSYYRYEPFLEEACALQKDARGGNPDHPKGGSKDILDALAAVAANAFVEGKQGAAKRAQVWARVPVVGRG